MNTHLSRVLNNNTNNGKSLMQYVLREEHQMG